VAELLRDSHLRCSLAALSYGPWERDAWRVLFPVEVNGRKDLTGTVIEQVQVHVVHLFIKAEECGRRKS
jgi:hypothetical protein